jgi:Raf kinase inhibitor-like YbhB/YbcL family protein
MEGLVNSALHKVASISLIGLLAVLFSFPSLGCATEERFHDVTIKKERVTNTLRVTSPVFSHNQEIPVRYTCDGAGISPPLEWSGLPKATKALVLIVYDPDAPNPLAPKMTWVHWVLYNIPPSVSGLAEGVRLTDLPKETKEGLNGWKRTGYGGPCPPIGHHRYFHTLYALDLILPDDLGRPTKEELEKAMKGHVLSKGELIGTYQRSR